MVLPPVQDDKSYTIVCWAQGKKNPIVNVLEILVSIVDNGFIFNVC